MLRVHIAMAGIVVLSAACLARGQNPTAKTDTPLAQAQRLAGQRPSVAHWLGLAELRRAAGQRQEAIADLARAVQAADAGPRTVELQEFLCWRMLPVSELQRAAFRQEVARLREVDQSSLWLPVYELYQIILERDRRSLLASVARMPARLPERFPTAAGEAAQLELL